MLQDYPIFKLILSYYEGLIQYQGNHFPCPSTRTITQESHTYLLEQTPIKVTHYSTKI